jgi:hypothetical protein
MKAHHLTQKVQTSYVSEISCLLLCITIPGLYRATEFQQLEGLHQEFHTLGIFYRIMFHKLPELSFVSDCNGPEYTIDFSTAAVI